jgi:ribosomal-protein-alanine N-acetyltransferase
MWIDHGTLYVSHWSRAAYEKYVAELREDFFHRCLLVAVEGENVIGFVAGSFLEGDDAALLENLAVDANWRRRGIARALCAAFIDWAKSEGAWGVDLEVRVTNEAALAFYAVLQFVEQGRRRNYYSDPEEDAVLMALRFS